MFNVQNIRKDFPILNTKTNSGKDLVYFDNGATTFKPKCVIDKIRYCYEEMTANAHRGDYDLSHNVDVAFEESRETIAKFINAPKDCVVFSANDSASLNIVAYGIQESFIEEGDEIILNEGEHASNLLPWYRVADTKKAIIKYIPLDSEGKITPENLKKVITKKTKVISFAHVGNVLGYLIDAKRIIDIAHEHGALVVLDGAQSVPHIKIDVKELDVDFLTFSAHKMCGPTGLGIMYGKYELLEKMPPLLLGGGMNTRFYKDGQLYLKKPPYRFESGTQPIEAVIAFKEAIDYITSIGIENIHKYELKLREYALEKMKEVEDLIIYNANANTGIITLNIKNVFAQDLSTHLNSYGIATRSGQHCAKLLNEIIGTPSTVRVSFYFYNTFEEIDVLIAALKKGRDFLDVYFG